MKSSVSARVFALFVMEALVCLILVDFLLEMGRLALSVGPSLCLSSTSGAFESHSLSGGLTLVIYHNFCI